MSEQSATNFPEPQKKRGRPKKKGADNASDAAPIVGQTQSLAPAEAPKPSRLHWTEEMVAKLMRWREDNEERFAERGTPLEPRPADRVLWGHCAEWLGKEFPSVSGLLDWRKVYDKFTNLRKAFEDAMTEVERKVASTGGPGGEYVADLMRRLFPEYSLCASVFLKDVQVVPPAGTVLDTSAATQGTGVIPLTEAHDRVVKSLTQLSGIGARDEAARSEPATAGGMQTGTDARTPPSAGRVTPADSGTAAARPTPPEAASGGAAAAAAPVGARRPLVGAKRKGVQSGDDNDSDFRAMFTALSAAAGAITARHQQPSEDISALRQDVSDLRSDLAGVQQQLVQVLGALRALQRGGTPP